MEGGFVAFPLEIYQLIIAQVASDATRPWETVRSDLNSCCLVAKSFVQICREFIFQDITIYNTLGRTPKIHALATFLCHNPRLSTRVRNLTWRIGPTRETETRQGNIMTALNIMTAFFGLPNVRSLAVHSKIPVNYAITSYLLEHYLPIGCITEVSISHVREIPLLAFLKSPALKALSFHKCTITISGPPFAHNPLPRGSSLVCIDFTSCEESTTCFLLRYCQDLQEIRLEYGSSDHDQPEPASGEPAPVFPRLLKLTSHSMYEWDPLTVNPPTAPAFPALRDLSLTNMWNTQSIRSSFQHITTLETLSIEGDEKSWTRLFMGVSGPLRNLLLTNQHTLKRMKIRWSIPHLSSSNFLETLLGVLRPIDGRNVLEELDLDFNFWLVDRPSVQTAFNHWNQLDTLLWSNDDSFATLKRVRLCLQLHLDDELSELSRVGWDAAPEDWKMLKEPLRGWRSKNDILFDSQITLVPRGL